MFELNQLYNMDCMTAMREIPDKFFELAICDPPYGIGIDGQKLIMNRVELLKDGTFHPTQKPVKLYEWLISRYAKEGDKILDTHAGSGACLIAAHRTQHEFLGFEIDADYFQKAAERIKAEQAQMTIFDFIGGAE